jgi:hypothetical protein
LTSWHQSFIFPRQIAPVAQWIEHQPPELGVVGSIPTGRANEIKRSGRKCLTFFIAYLALPHRIPHIQKVFTIVYNG